MFAILYLVLAYFVGQCFYNVCFAGRVEAACARTMRRTPVPLSGWEIKIPTAFTIGTLLLTWLTYLGALLTAGRLHPLATGNAISFFVAGSGLAIYAGPRYARAMAGWLRPETSSARLGSFRRSGWTLGLTLFFAAAATMLMTQTLFLRADGTLLIGLTVFSDFGPHLGLIRSFVHGHNFPTEYPHFPAGNIRYHFLFQFLAGNLEFLGLPVDWAFNLPSVLALTSAALMLYSLAVVITGSRAAGMMTVTMACLRSSWAWYEYVARDGFSLLIFKRLLGNEEFIGSTQNEAAWGLWNQNVYLNQRHLSFGLTLLFLVLVAVFPTLRDRFSRPFQNETPPPGSRWRRWVRRDEWLARPGCALPAVALGLVLGLAGSWNGATVIATLLLLFALTLVSRHRGEHIIIALTTVAICWAENRLFIGSAELAIAPKIVFGFLADEATLKGVVSYCLQLLGILPWLLVVAVSAPYLVRYTPGKEFASAWRLPLALVFALPFAFAMTISLTPELAINHKYVLISVLLLNIIVADFLVGVVQRRSMWSRFVFIGLIVCLTGTGLIDLIACFNRNRASNAVTVKMNDPLLRWALNYTAPTSVFLTDWYYIHPLLMAGRKLFFGWPYYAWSAGYDTNVRLEVVKNIYGGTSPANIRRLVAENGIDYIVIDSANRQQPLYKLQEPLLRQMFSTVYEDEQSIVLSVGRQ